MSQVSFAAPRPRKATHLFCHRQACRLSHLYNFVWRVHVIKLSDILAASAIICERADWMVNRASLLTVHSERHLPRTCPHLLIHSSAELITILWRLKRWVICRSHIYSRFQRRTDLSDGKLSWAGPQDWVLFSPSFRLIALLLHLSSLSFSF